MFWHTIILPYWFSFLGWATLPNSFYLHEVDLNEMSLLKIILLILCSYSYIIAFRMVWGSRMWYKVPLHRAPCLISTSWQWSQVPGAMDWQNHWSEGSMSTCHTHSKNEWKETYIWTQVLFDLHLTCIYFISFFSIIKLKCYIDIEADMNIYVVCGCDVLACV